MVLFEFIKTLPTHVKCILSIFVYRDSTVIIHSPLDESLVITNY